MAGVSYWQKGCDAYQQGLSPNAFPKVEVTNRQQLSWIHGWEWAQQTQQKQDGLPTFDEYCAREEIENPHPEFRAGYNALRSHLMTTWKIK